MNTVIVHEWLEPTGGAEKVVDRIASILPTASIYSLWNDAPGRFQNGRVTESWLAQTWLRGRKAAALPLMPVTWRTLGESDADTILCSSHLFAHHARFGGKARAARKLVYAYTPARYIWEPEIDGRGQSLAARAASAMLRPLDKKRAGEATSIAGISKFVVDRIARSWNREARVIYPPVAARRLAESVESLSAEDELALRELPDNFVLGASRLVPYKRLDDVIRLGEVCDVPVVIAGSGPDAPRLRILAEASGSPVHFVQRPSDPLLAALYRRAAAFAFPAIEDFGIMPVEAMALGTPVIGLTRGGVSETVLDGQSGALIDSFESKQDVRSALHRAANLRGSAIVDLALRFDEGIFDERIRAWLAEEN